MEEATARRGLGAKPPHRHPPHQAGYYETACRVLGRYIDEQKPRDVFFFEQDGAFVLRLLLGSQAGSRHELAEFTREDITQHGRARTQPSPSGHEPRVRQHDQRLTPQPIT